MPSTFWTDNVKASLEVCLGNVRRLPEGELLRVDELNQILDLLNQVRTTFMLQCSMNGFSTDKPKPKTE